MAAVVTDTESPTAAGSATRDVPVVDISDSVREFAGQNGDYYAREFGRLQSRKVVGEPGCQKADHRR